MSERSHLSRLWELLGQVWEGVRSAGPPLLSHKPWHSTRTCRGSWRLWLSEPLPLNISRHGHGIKSSITAQYFEKCVPEMSKRTLWTYGKCWFSVHPSKECPKSVLWDTQRVDISTSGISWDEFGGVYRELWKIRPISGFLLFPDKLSRSSTWNAQSWSILTDFCRI